MNWDDLKILAELARSGSLAGTARRLRLDHTTVSRRIAALEESLGVRLLERLPRGATLTVEAERIAEAAQRMEEHAFTVARLAQGSALSGRVRITAPPHFASSFLAPRLVAFRHQHPGIQTELMAESRAVSLARREADIAVRMTRPQGDSLVAQRLGAMAFGLYGARDYLAATARADWDWVGFDDELDHMPQQRWLRKRAGERPLVFRSNEQSVQMAAIRAGMGLGVLPCYLASADPLLEPVPADPPPAPRDIWLVIHAETRRSPRIRAAADFLAAAIRAEAPALEGK